MEIIYRAKNRLLQHDITETDRGTGALPQIADKRDRIQILGAVQPDYEKGFRIEDYLNQAYNRPVKLAVKDQGQSLSCGGQAVATLAAVLNYIETGVMTEFSAHDAYSHNRLWFGGVRLRDIIDWYVDNGVLAEGVFSSYDNGKPPTDDFMKKKPQDTNLDFQERSILRAESYATFDSSMDNIAKAIEVNKGCLVVLDGANNGTWWSDMPRVEDATIWSHIMYFGGYGIYKKKPGLWGFQTWGDKVGIDGWQFFTQEWFDARKIYTPWVVQDRPNSQDNQDNLQKISDFVFSNPTLPEPNASYYSDINWEYVQKQTKVFIKQGKHYDFEMAKKYKDLYKL